MGDGPSGIHGSTAMLNAIRYRNTLAGDFAPQVSPCVSDHQLKQE